MSRLSKKKHILVVDDSIDTLEVLKRNLTSLKHIVFTASSVAEAIKFLDSTQVDLVITDIKMPKQCGHDLIRHINENFKDTEVIAITGFPSIEGAIMSVKTGAEEYLAKPFTDEELFSSVHKALEKLYLRRTMQAQSNNLSSASCGIIGQSKEITNILKDIKKAASTKEIVLITGESGTGKELVARGIHYNSSRASAKFVPINCGSIPDNLIESELFGYVKGSFTGAEESRAGFFHVADGGTIFLDEISETSASMQVKLLRVLQDKEVCMIGSRRPQKIDIKILAATNKKLSSLVKKGMFREDLYYRLNVITIDIPPLRERGNDILQLTQHFATEYCVELDKPIPNFSDNALAVLKEYYWPGNVRELKNIVKRLVLMTEEEIIDVPDFPSLMRFSALRRERFNRKLAEVEKDYISNVLATVEGNKTKAAKILGIDRKTLREKLK